MPTMRVVPQERHLGRGQRPADPGAAEYGRRLVHARDRRVAGRPRLDQQHVPHERPAVRHRTAAFDPGVLQAETIAQSAERGGLKVAQVEWAGGRNATINGPTIDFQSFFSGRGVATNFIGTAGDALFDDAPFITASASSSTIRPGYAGTGAVPGRRPIVRRPAGPASRRRSARPRRCASASSTAATDKYGLNAYIFDSTNDGTINYDKVLFSRTKSAARRVGTLRKGEWADVKVKISRRRPRRQDRGHARQGRGAHRATSRASACSTRPSAGRIASWPTLGGRAGLPAATSRSSSPRSSRPRPPPTSRSSRPA